MKQYVVFGLILGLLTSVRAQVLTIIDESTEKPLELVTIYCEDLKVHAMTNSRGQADLTPFQGAENIQISYLGFETLDISYKDIEEKEFRLVLQPTNFNLNEIVVSGTRWRQTSDNVPAKIISIAPEEVKLQNPQTAADLLGLSGKVFIQKSQQGGGSPMIRGFASNRLLYTVDGIRMNNAIFRGGNIQNVINLDPFVMENIEVLFGPGSVIYGSDAIGGVMSFQTITPQFSANETTLLSGKVVGRYASANQERTGHFDLNLGYKKWAFASSVSFWNYDHLRQGRNGPNDYLKEYFVSRENGEDIVLSQENPLLQIPSGYSQLNLMQKVHYKPSDRWDFQYGFHYSTTSDYGRYDRHNRVQNGQPRYAQWDYGPQRWIMNNLTIDHSAPAKLFDEFTLRIAHQSFEESRIERAFNRTDQTTNTENLEALSANFDLIKKTHDHNSIFYGMEYVFNVVNSSGQIRDIETDQVSIGPSRYPDASWQSLGFYLQNDYQFSSKLSVQGGLRYNIFSIHADFTDNLSFFPFAFTESELHKAAITGNLGAVWRPLEGWVINANFGTAFRSPNVDDIGKIFDSEPGALTVPNPDLEAEYAYNWDLGTALLLGNNIRLDLTGYYTVLQNALVRRNFTLDGVDSILYAGQLSQVQAIQNAAVAHVMGLQAGIEIILPAGFSILSDINFQKGEEELDDGNSSPSRHAAPTYGVTRLNYRNHRLKIQLYALYQGKRPYNELSVDERNKDEIYAKDAQGNNYAPSWYTLNLKSKYELKKHWTFSAGVENMTNQRYRPYSSGLSAPGINFFCAIQFDF